MSFEADILDTAAYRVMKQIVDHSWDLDWSLEEKDVININLVFQDLGGSWEQLMDGDIRHVGLLENSVETWINARPLLKIAKKIM